MDLDLKKLGPTYWSRIKKLLENFLKILEKWTWKLLKLLYWARIDFCIEFGLETLREKCPNMEFFLVRIFPHSDWTDRYLVSLRIQSECGKIRTRKTPYLDKFHTVKGTRTTLLDFDWFYDVFRLDFKNTRTTRTWLRLFLLCIRLGLIKSVHQVGMFCVTSQVSQVRQSVVCVCVCVCVCEKPNILLVAKLAKYYSYWARVMRVQVLSSSV